MPLLKGWDPASAVAAGTIAPWQGAVWRGHSQSRSATDSGGSLKRSGRWHRAADQLPPHPTWPALYTALDRSIAMGEVRRNAEETRFNQYRYTELRVDLQAVVSWPDPSALGVASTDLLDDEDFAAPQALALAARALGVEGMLVPSATLLGDNLIIFPDLVRPASVILEISSVDPHLDKRGSPRNVGQGRDI